MFFTLILPPDHAKFQPFIIFNAPIPRKSVNALPSSPNASDAGSSMILAASPFQAHHSLQLHQCSLVSAE
ncbi:hypothetical protein K525DRAFT_158491, partial [Schizophyllum commune Loenen D]